MNKKIHYKPGNLDKKYTSKNSKTKRSLLRAFKKKIRRMLGIISQEDMEE